MMFIKFLTIPQLVFCTGDEKLFIITTYIYYFKSLNFTLDAGLLSSSLLNTHLIITVSVSVTSTRKPPHDLPLNACISPFRTWNLLSSLY